MALAHHRHKLSALMRRRIYMVRTMLALILVALVFAVLGGIYNLNLSSTGQMSEYYSASLGIAFQHPPGYDVVVKTNSGYLQNNQNVNSKILFSTQGSFYDSVMEHVGALSTLNKINIKETTAVSNANFPTNALRVNSVTDSSNRISYFFMHNKMVYSFSTDNPSLFSDLDAIAQSFRIIQ